MGAPSSLKIFALEGEFAFTEGHAQELKTMALAQQVGKRLRLFFSYNNAGIFLAALEEAERSSRINLSLKGLTTN